MNKNNNKKTWISEHINDIYVKRSKKDGYRSRAVYKLQEIDKKDKLFKPGQYIIDLGASPGSWSQYISYKIQQKNNFLFKKNKINSKIIALDILPINPINGVQVIQADLFNKKMWSYIKNFIDRQFVDIIISDISPSISGISSIDIPCIYNLLDITLEFSSNFLKKDGNILVKCFHGKEYDIFLKKLKYLFNIIKVRKPLASRSRSNEIFIICKEFRF